LHTVSPRRRRQRRSLDDPSQDPQGAIPASDETQERALRLQMPVRAARCRPPLGLPLSELTQLPRDSYPPQESPRQLRRPRHTQVTARPLREKSVAVDQALPAQGFVQGG
jgi:hypothetical protein